MAKVKRTYAELIVLKRIQDEYLKEHEGDEETKLCACMRNVAKQMDKIARERDLFISNIAVDHCMVDEKTQRILKDAQGHPEFTKKGMRDRDKAVLEYADNQFEIDSRIVVDFNVSVLTPEEREAFSGIYIPVQAQDEDGVFLHELSPAVLGKTTFIQVTTHSEPVHDPEPNPSQS